MGTLVTTNLALCHKALVSAVTLWGDHALPVTVDTVVIAPLIGMALDFENHGNATLAFSSCSSFLRAIMGMLDGSQLVELQNAGIELQLHHLLEHHFRMDRMQLEDLLVCIAGFAERGTPTITLWGQGIVTSLAALACMKPTSFAVQMSVWKLLATYSQLAGHKQKVPDDVIGAAVSALGQENSYLSDVILLYLCTTCKANTPNMDVALSYLGYPGLVKAILPIAQSGPPTTVESICFLLSRMAPVATMPQLIDFNIIGTLEDCARLSPESCLVLTCGAIQAILSPTISQWKCEVQREFYKCDHSAFFKEVLSNEAVYSNKVLLQSVYETLILVLKGGSTTTLQTLYTNEFISFFATIFERDGVLTTHAGHVVNTWLNFVPTTGDTKAVTLALHTSQFHASLMKVLPKMVDACTMDKALLTNATSLLSNLVVLYNTNKVDMKAILQCGVHDFIADCLKTLNTVRTCNSQQSATNLCLTLYYITLNKEASLELHSIGFTEKLAQLQRLDCPLIHRFIVSALCHITFYEKKAQLFLIEKNYHSFCLSLLKSNPESQDPYLLAACCSLIRLLCKDDMIKKTLVEKECVPTLVKILKLMRGSSYLVSFALGLLARIISSSEVECNTLLSVDLIQTVSGFLQDNQDGKVMMNAIIILLQSIQLDLMIPVIRQAVPISVLVCAKNKTDVKGLNVMATMLIEGLHLNCIIAQGETVPKILVLHSGLCGWPRVNSDPAQSSLDPCFPMAPELDHTHLQQLASLGLNVDKPVLRIGQMEGIQSNPCGCHIDKNTYDNLIMRPHGLTLGQYQELINNGWFRRGGVKLYRTTQCHDTKCTLWETRVLVKDFDYHLHKNYAKVVRRMPAHRLTVETRPTHYSMEAHQLYNQYNIGRHDRHQASDFHYREHVVDSPIRNEAVNGIEYGSYHQLYRLDGKLVAVGLIDIVPKGIVSVYMWYSLEKEVSKYSLGVYSALKEIEMVRELSKKNPEMKYYYLQGWNANDKKLAYKANYPPEEYYCACITPEWLPSLNAVKEVKEKYLKEHILDQNGHPSCNAATPVALQITVEDKKVSTDVPCSAFDKDRAIHQQLTGHKPDVSKMVVCLNYSIYMHLGEVFSNFGVEQSQRELMERRFEELVVAIGPELGANLVVDLKVASPVS